MAARKLSTTVSTKGQVILPKEARDITQWGPGAKLDVDVTAERIVLTRKPLFPPTRIEDVAGILKYDGPPLSLEDMDDAITAEVRDQIARGRY
jgi:AbrB family looped-hinge helix DNA binding protein